MQHTAPRLRIFGSLYLDSLKLVARCDTTGTNTQIIFLAINENVSIFRSPELFDTGNISLRKVQAAFQLV